MCRKLRSKTIVDELYILQKLMFIITKYFGKIQVKPEFLETGQMVANSHYWDLSISKVVHLLRGAAWEAW